MDVFQIGLDVEHLHNLQDTDEQRGVIGIEMIFYIHIFCNHLRGVVYSEQNRALKQNLEEHQNLIENRSLRHFNDKPS